MANILANYQGYMDKNPLLFASPEATKSIITEDVEYNAFVDALLEGTNNAQDVRKVLDREREMLLLESEAFLGSPEGIAYAVSAYPMIVFQYSSPVLSEGCTLYTTQKPVFTVPRLKWMAKIIDEVGGVTELEFPTAVQEVRPGVKTLDLTSQYGNIFTLLSIDKNEFRISKRGLMVTGVDATETDSASGTHTHNIAVYAGIDARGNFAIDITVTDNDGVDGVFKLTGNIETTSGDVNWAVVAKDYTGASTFAWDSITTKFRLFGIGNNKSVVKVYPKNEILDINCGEDSSFEIENIAEVIQDWKSLYNIDIFAQLNDMVRLQLELNRDWDIADLLRAAEPDMAAGGLSRVLDLASIPAIAYQNYQDVLKSVVPKVMAIRERIFKLTRRYANVVFTGTDAAAWLKSLQDYAISLEGGSGTLSHNGSMGDFAKMKILNSNAIDDNRIYVLVKGQTPSEAVILVSTYKPLYTIKETTDSRTRMFIKSRVSVDLVRSDSAGFIELQNYEDYL